MSIALRWAYILAAPICLAQGPSFSPPNIIQTFVSNGTTIASPTVSVNLSVSGAGTLTLSASTQSGGNWLSITPATGPTPLAAIVTPSLPSFMSGAAHFDRRRTQFRKLVMSQDRQSNCGSRTSARQ